MFSTWLFEDHAQVHPEGADPSGHKGKGLRMESLGWKLSPILGQWMAPPLVRFCSPDVYLLQ